MSPDRDRNYNVIVIGAGSGGLVTAAGTVGLGGRVALIERHKMGGDCLNYGCVPSKALIASASAVHAMRHADRFGLERHEPRFDFNAVFERMRDRRARLEPNDSQERFEAMGVDVFRGDARLVSPNEVEVDGRRLKAANLVIATGTRPAVPPIDGLEDVPYHTNETIFDELHEAPGHLAVVGGGPVGCELGQMFQRLGVKVTLVEMADRLLMKEDPDVAALVQQRLAAEGVDVRCRTQVKAVRKTGPHGMALTLAGVAAGDEGEGDDERTLEVDTLLIAAGRTPNVASLGLGAVGIEATGKGITVNDYLQTSQRNVFAVGDVTGHPAFTHAADAQARVVVRNILTPWLMTKFDAGDVPWATYTDPEVAKVGLNESEAKQRGIAYDLYTQPMDELDRAIVSEADVGFVKVLTKRGSDRLLGASLVAPHAGELMHEFALALRHGIGLGKLASTVHAYPTLSEAARKLGDQYNRSRLTPRTRRVFEWLYRRARRRVPD